MKEKGKTAIICMGGGMRSAHGAGFLYELAQLGITSPDIMIGTSGNAGNMLYYISKQYETAVRVWCTGMLSTSKLVSYLRIWRVLNIDYLIDDIFKKRAPLDLAALAQSPIDWFIPATDVVTGQTRYFSKKDNLDIYELMRVAKAAPVFYGRRLPLLGHLYADGEMGPTPLDHVHYALSLGADRILIVNDNVPVTKINSLTTHVYAMINSKNLRNAIVHDLQGMTCVTADNATIVCVYPKELKMGLLTRNKNKLVQAFDLGKQNALAMRDELYKMFDTA